MNKYSDELQEEILNEEDMQYDEEIKDEMSEYLLFGDNKE